MKMLQPIINEIKKICIDTNCQYKKTCIRTFKLKHRCFNEVNEG